MVTREKTNVWGIGWINTDGQWDETELNGNTYEEVLSLFLSMADEFQFNNDMDSLCIEETGYEVVTKQDGIEIDYVRVR